MSRLEAAEASIFQSHKSSVNMLYKAVSSLTWGEEA